MIKFGKQVTIKWEENVKFTDKFGIQKKITKQKITSLLTWKETQKIIRKRINVMFSEISKKKSCITHSFLLNKTSEVLTHNIKSIGELNTSYLNIAQFTGAQKNLVASC